MTEYEWNAGALRLRVDAHNGPARLMIAGPGTRGAIGVPLVEVFHTADGHRRSSIAAQSSAVGTRLRVEAVEADENRLSVVQRDEQTGLVVTWTALGFAGVDGFQANTRVRNEGSVAVRLEAVTSFVASLWPASDRDDLVVHYARNEWLAEYRWLSDRVSDLIPDIDVGAHGQDPRGRFSIGSRGTWSSGEFLPMGVIEHGESSCVAFQIESSGAWSWEMVEREGTVAVAVSGPTDHESAWSRMLDVGEEFDTVPVGIVVARGLDDTFGALTRYRRALRAPHPTDTTLPVVYNTWMNTLAMDVTDETVLPLVERAAAVGAEIFCIDAGWYDNLGDPHDNLGEWVPSRDRFSNGLSAVLDATRAAGMSPGLWMEPEVVGTETAPARTLPDEAFFSRGGVRVRDWDRYHLDLRHPDVRRSLDDAVDALVSGLGVEMFKLDYNADFGSGTDIAADSVGDGALNHHRALHDWLRGIAERHPAVLIESCSSGAMRVDYGLLVLTQLQSTSDQQNELRYAAIAAASPSAIVPEQAGNWAYPQPGMSDERIVFTMSNGLLTRLYLSGHLDGMNETQLSLVAEGVRAHKGVRATIARSVPGWPLGLPGWDDDALALRVGDCLTIWWRGDAAGEVRIPLAGATHVEELYPIGRTGWDFSVEDDVLIARCELDEPSARSVRLLTAGKA